MRQITKQMAEAFQARRPKSNGNTTTDGISLFLHGNKIAQHAPSQLGVYISLAGWATSTTKERLNGLLGVLGLHAYPRHSVGIHQANHVQYLGSHCGNPSMPDHKEWKMIMDPSAWYFVPFDGSQASQVESPTLQEAV